MVNRRSLEETKSYEEKFRDEEKKVDHLLNELREKTKELEEALQAKNSTNGGSNSGQMELEKSS